MKIPHIVSIAKSPASPDCDTCNLYAVYSLAAISLSLGFDYTFDANNGGMQWEDFIFPPQHWASLRQRMLLHCFYNARSEPFYIRRECSDHYQHNLTASSENEFSRTDFIHLQLT